MSYSIFIVIIVLFFSGILMMPFFLEVSFLLYGLRFLFSFICAVATLMLFKKMFYDKILSERKKNIALLFFSLLLLVLSLENIFMLVPKSHDFGGYTYGARVWLKYFWKPINSYGYRDNEPDKEKPAILFVGDSFTAGHGINNIQNRFSNLTCSKLGSYQCINIGQSGADTRMEYNNMIGFIEKSKIKPTVIVLQYYGNDIDRLAMENGIAYNGFNPFQRMTTAARLSIKSSFLANYIYWLFPHEDKTYIEFLTKAYGDSTLFSQHTSDLNKFAEYAGSNGIEFIVVAYPFLLNPNIAGTLYMKQVLAFFQGKNVKTIDVTPIITPLKMKERLVNQNDGHASVKVNELVADKLVELISKQ